VFPPAVPGFERRHDLSACPLTPRVDLRVLGYPIAAVIRDKIITGSFDKTAKLWDVETGSLYHTYRGHTTEIVCLSFDPLGTTVATGSMDNTAKLWDVETGAEKFTLLVRGERSLWTWWLQGFGGVGHVSWLLTAVSFSRVPTKYAIVDIGFRVVFLSVQGHTAEIVSLNFNQTGNQIITGSFDHTVKVWDTRTGTVIHTLAGHHGEISSTQYNYTGDMCISGSIDRTCKIWDIGRGACVQVAILAAAPAAPAADAAAVFAAATAAPAYQVTKAIVASPRVLSLLVGVLVLVFIRVATAAAAAAAAAGVDPNRTDSPSS
jgi:WD40 repeat protein